MIETLSVSGSGGVRLHVEACGPRAGTPVLLLHGQLHSARVFRRLMTGPLAESFRFVAPDFRGHGFSEKPRDDSYHRGAAWAADVAAVIAACGLDRPVIVAWSFGAVVACDHLRHGGEPRALALVGAGTHNRGVPLWPAPVVRVLVRAARGVPALRPPAMGAGAVALGAAVMAADGDTFAAAAERMIRMCRATEVPREELLSLVGDTVRIPAHVRLAIATRGYDNRPPLRAYKGPVLQIHGEKDRIRLPIAAAERARVLARGRTEIWPASGHAPFLDEPERFETTLEQWINEVA